MDFDVFDWDEGNAVKCRKNGVSSPEIEELFLSGCRIAPAAMRLDREARFLAIGRTSAGRHLFVAFTWRLHAERRLIRPISARYMHRKEVEALDQEEPS